MSTQTIKSGTRLSWGKSGSTNTMTFTSLAANAARQGPKQDMGATRADKWNVQGDFEFGTAPTAGGAIEVWWAGSENSTAGTDNPAGASGTDAAYKAGEEDEWKVLLEYLGSFIVTNDGSGTVQSSRFTCDAPKNRYGMPVIVNKASQALVANNTNHQLTITPIQGDSA